MNHLYAFALHHRLQEAKSGTASFLFLPFIFQMMVALQGWRAW